MRTVNAFVGQPIERLEDFRFVRGRGQYVDDLARNEHAACGDPAQRGRPRPHPRYRRVAGDKKSPACMPSSPRPISAIASRWCRCGCSRCRNSKPSASRSWRATRCAMSARRWPWCWPTAPASPRTRSAPSKSTSSRCRPLRTGRARRRTKRCCSRTKAAIVTMKFRAVLGDADAAFKNAPYTRRERFSTQRHTALPMEPRGLLAEWDAASGRLTCRAPPRCCSPTAASSPSSSASPKMPSTWSNTTSAAALARAASSIRKIF